MIIRLKILKLGQRGSVIIGVIGRTLIQTIKSCSIQFKENRLLEVVKKDMPLWVLEPSPEYIKEVIPNQTRVI